MTLDNGVMGYYYLGHSINMPGGTLVGQSKAPHISKFVEFYTVVKYF